MSLLERFLTTPMNGVSTEANFLAAQMQAKKWKFFTPEQAQGYLDDPNELDEVDEEYVSDFLDCISYWSNSS